ncbi:amidase [Limibacillus halophilus]
MIRDIVRLSAREMLRRFAERSLSPLEVADALLAAIEEENPKINAYCLLDAEAGRAAAKASEERWAKGAPLGALDGVPVSVKDVVLTKGWPTLRGSKTVDPDQAWDQDAPAVARLREAGAVLYGKTTTSEFGWKATGDCPLTGITRNPWNLEHTTGASSAGAAAQLAAALGPLAIGTDGGGSIRIPCSFSGLVGIKQTFGRVAAWPASPFGTVAHVGPMARSVADTALFYEVLAKPDPRDWYSLPFPVEPFDPTPPESLKGLRVAFSPNLGYAEVDPEVAALVAAGAKKLSELGATVEQRDPGFDNPQEIFMVLWRSGARRLLNAIPKEKWPLIDPGLIKAVEEAAAYGLPGYLEAVAQREALGARMQAFQQDYDLLVTPTMPRPALKVGELFYGGVEGKDWTDWSPFSYPFNMTQQPALSLPCGLTSEGLPVGLQIVGRRFEEKTVFTAASALEAALGFKPLWER